MDFLGVNRRRSTSADSRQTRRRRCCTLRSSRSATSSTSRCRPIRRARALTRALRSSRLRHQKQRSTPATTCIGIASQRSRTGGGSSRSTRQSRQREPASMAAISRVSSLCTGHFARSLQDVFLLTFRYSLCPAAPTCPNLCSRTASLGLGGVDRSTRHSWSRRTRRWSAGRGRRRVLTRRGVNPPHESRAAVPTTLL
jgi:hypothetical protein